MSDEEIKKLADKYILPNGSRPGEPQHDDSFDPTTLKKALVTAQRAQLNFLSIGLEHQRKRYEVARQIFPEPEWGKADFRAIEGIAKAIEAAKQPTPNWRRF